MSKPSDKSFKLDFLLEKLSGCCGIWEAKEFYWNYDNLLYGFDEHAHPSLSRMKQEAKRAKREVLHTAKCAVCTLTDDTEANRMLLEAFKHVGWKEHRKVMSNHGRYYIHLLSIQRRKK